MPWCNHVASYLTATTGLKYKPSGQAIVKFLTPENTAVLGPGIVASYKAATEAWEAAQAKNKDAPIDNSQHNNNFNNGQGTAGAPPYPYYPYMPPPMPSMPPYYYQQPPNGRN